MSGLRILVGVVVICCAAIEAVAGERLVLSTTEARTLLFFKANNDAVDKLLPAGWSSNPGTGPTKDANMFIALIEGIAAGDGDGKAVLHQGKTAVLVLPVKEEKTGSAAAMVVGGFVSEPQAAPGAYNVYVPAKVSMAKTARSEENGSTTIEESWDIATEAGDKLRFNAVYTRGIGTRARIEPRIYAAVKPDFYRIYKADQVTEIVHSTAEETKRARKVELSATGPQIAKLFDGSEQLVAVMSIPAYYRQVFLPE
jgi:hypothetical protein